MANTLEKSHNSKLTTERANTFAHLSNGHLFHELEFLFYEAGRIARGHAEAVDAAMKEAMSNMRQRGFDSVGELRMYVTGNEANYAAFIKLTRGDKTITHFEPMT